MMLALVAGLVVHAPLKMLALHGPLASVLAVPAAAFAWKEVLALAIALVGIGFFWHKPPDRIDLAAGLYIAVSVVAGLAFTGDWDGRHFPHNLPQIAWGAKYSLLFLLLFLGVRRIDFTSKTRQLLRRAVALAGAVVVCLGLLVAVFPQSLLAFGYAPQHGNTQVASSGEALSYCHKIERDAAEQEFCRAQGTLSGPNQLGAYLLVALPALLWAGAAAVAGSWRRKAWLIIFGAGCALLLLSFSRAAMLGGLVAAAGAFVLAARSRGAATTCLALGAGGLAALLFPLAFGAQFWDATPYFSAFLAAVAAVAAAVLAYQKRRALFAPLVFLGAAMLGGLAWLRAFWGEFMWNIVVRPASSGGHWERMYDGIMGIWQRPLGLGLGDAGPASARFAAPGETGFLPESLFLEVGLASGVLGLLLFLAFCWLLLGSLLPRARAAEYAQDRFAAAAAAAALLGILVMGLFLHSTESAAAMLTLFVWVGLACGLSGAEGRAPVAGKLQEYSTQ